VDDSGSKEPIKVTIVPVPPLDGDYECKILVNGNIDVVLRLSDMIGVAVTWWGRWYPALSPAAEAVDRAVREYVGEERWVIEWLKRL
jgi:hypothetical protein